MGVDEASELPLSIRAREVIPLIFTWLVDLSRDGLVVAKTEGAEFVETEENSL